MQSEARIFYSQLPRLLEFSDPRNGPQIGMTSHKTAKLQGADRWPKASWRSRGIGFEVTACDGETTLLQFYIGWRVSDFFEEVDVWGFLDEDR